MGRPPFRAILLFFLTAWLGVAVAQEAPATDDTVSAEDTAAAEEAAEAAERARAEEARRALQRELRTSEQRAWELKERVFRSKATLQLLRELVATGGAAGSGLRLTHVDELGRAYRIESIQYFLDGRAIFSWSDPTDTQKPPAEVEIRDDAITPGQHAVQVSMVVRGDGGGVFRYLEDYRFTVESSYTFEVDQGMRTDLRVIAQAEAGVKKRFEDRPTIVYDERKEALQTE